MTRNIAAASLIAATAMLLAACDQESGQPGPAGAGVPDAEATAAESGGDPCAFISPDEMGAVLERPVTRQEEPSADRCLYYTEDPLVYVDLTIDRENAAEAWKGIGIGNEMIDADQDSVAGLGEQAVFGPRDRLYVLSGDAFLAIEAGFDDKARERARKVAALALDKLR